MIDELQAARELPVAVAVQHFGRHEALLAQVSEWIEAQGGTLLAVVGQGVSGVARCDQGELFGGQTIH